MTAPPEPRPRPQPAHVAVITGAGAELAVRGGATREEGAVLLAVVTQLTPRLTSRTSYEVWRDARRAAIRRTAARRSVANGCDFPSW